MSQDTASNNSFYIATANLLNFANPNRIFYENAPAYTNKAYEHKLNGLSSLLSNAHADIIAVQEAWDSRAVESLAVSLGFETKDVIIPLASNEQSSPYTQGRGAIGTPAVGIISRFETIETSLLETLSMKRQLIFQTLVLIVSLNVRHCWLESRLMVSLLRLSPLI